MGDRFLALRKGSVALYMLTNDGQVEELRSDATRDATMGDADASMDAHDVTTDSPHSAAKPKKSRSRPRRKK